MLLTDVDAGDGIVSRLGSWKFNETVANTFDKHVMKSVPLYLDTQLLVGALSDWFVGENSTIIDLGCATGTTIHDLVQRHFDKDAHYIGIDNSVSMLTKAKQSLDVFSNVELLYRDICHFEYPTSDLILSLYTLQFIHPSQRAELCKKIYKSLSDRGGFILVEKVIDSDGVTADIFSQAHWGYKKQMGFSSNEIFGKAESLRGVMTPLTIEENFDMLKSAGFKRVSTFFKWCNFTGIIAIK